MKRFSQGFTVVELLIVIVVIGILAAITIVAYNGVTDRAEYARAQTDLKHINDAITIYKSQNGSYPTTNGVYVYQNNNPTAFLPDLVPSYLDQMPAGKVTSNPNFSYIYKSDGIDYKLLRYSGGQNLPSVEVANNPLMDPQRPNRAWGYWTSGAASW